MARTTISVAVLGGGVAGVVTANELSRHGGFSVHIIEKEQQLGGLQRSISLGGVQYDIGAFVFDRTHQLLRTFPGLYETFVETSHTNMALRESGRIDHYPLSVRGFLRDNGLSVTMLAALDILYSKARHARRDDLISYIKYYIGDTVYQRSGLKSYIERLYQTDDITIDLEFGKQRLQGIERDCSLRKNGPRIARQIFKAGREEIPWRCFVRPRGGFGEGYDVVAEQLRRQGVTIETGADIRTIKKSGDGFLIYFPDREEYFDRIISTIPIAATSGYIGMRLEHDLEYMSLVSLFYRFRGELGYDSPYLYNFTTSGDWKRIATFSRYYGTDGGDHYFAVECTVREKSAYSIEERRDGFERHIGAYQLFDGELRYQGGAVTPNAYPFFRRGDTEKIGRTRQRLADFGIETVGRQGSFVYTTSHETALNAAALAGALKAGARDRK